MYRKQTKKRYLKPRRRRQRRIKIRIIRSRILGRGVTRPYVDKRERLMLGSGSVKKAVKQVVFFPLGAALVAAPPIIDLLGKIIK